MDDVIVCADLHLVDLIDSMLIVDPEGRFTIEQCLAHPWLTQSGLGQQVSTKSAPVLRRKPTILSPGELVPSSTYIASSKELHGPGAGKSQPDPMIWTSEAEGIGRVSSVDIESRGKLILDGKLTCAGVL